MAWPTGVWRSLLGPVREQVATVAQAVAEFEPVSMIASLVSADEATKACGSKIEIVPIPIDDCWTRDTGPTFLINDEGECAGITWGFNGWGGRFKPYSEDAQLARRVLEKLELPTFEGPLIVEGGNLCVDGEGTLLTAETAVLNANRNPDLQRDEAEAILRNYLGIKQVIWLPGNNADTVTDGHIDGIACFCRPGVAIAEATEDKTDPEYESLHECRRLLKDATDARERKIEVLTLTRPRRVPSRSKDFCSSYLNFYIANGGIVMPMFGDDRADEAARQVVAQAFPGRRVVQRRIDAIAKGGGGIHCITQQQPSGQKPAAWE
jgi:agmatine deiminase